MRSSTPKISFIKLDRNDSYSIALRVCFHGRKELIIINGVPQSLKWDDKKERLKSSKIMLDVQRYNQIIDDKFQEVLSVCNQLSRSLPNYTSTDVIDALTGASKCLKKESDKLVDVVEELCEEKQLKLNTIKNYTVVLSNLSKFLRKDKKNLTIEDLTSLSSIKFIKWLSENQNENSSQNNCKKLIAIINYLIDKEKIGVTDNPFRKVELNKMLPIKTIHRALDDKDILRIEQYIQEVYMEDNSFKPEIKEKLRNRNCVEFATIIFVCGYYFQGLALVDMNNIKKSQLSFINKENVRYMKIEGVRRQKTGVPCPIIIEMTAFVNSLLEPFLNSDNDYLFPIVKDMTRDIKKVTNEFSRINNEINKNIKVMIDNINNYFQDDPLFSQINPTNVTYYSVRHSFATHFIKSGGNPTDLAVLLGRNPSGIFVYVDALGKEEDIIVSKKNMFKR